MTPAEISGLGFEIAFQGPAPDDIFFGIVRRGGAQMDGLRGFELKDADGYLLFFGRRR